MVTGARVIHISDLHTHEKNDNKVIEDSIAWLTIEAKPEDTVIVTGDVTDDGTPGQYAKALGLLLPLAAAGVRMVICKGNHDQGKMGCAYSKESDLEFKAFVGALGARGVDPYGPIAVLNIDTCIKSWWWGDFAQGRLGAWNARKIKKFGAYCA